MFVSIAAVSAQVFDAGQCLIIVNLPILLPRQATPENPLTMTRRQLRFLVVLAPQLVSDGVEQLDIALLGVLGQSSDESLRVSSPLRPNARPATPT